MTKIALIDAQQLLRVTLKNYIQSHVDFEVSLEVDSMKHIPLNMDVSEVQIVIYDPFKGGVEGFREIQAKFVNAKILVLTDQIDRDTVLSYIDQGASGYFSKNCCPNQLKSALTEIAINYDLREVRLGSLVRESLMNSANAVGRKKVKYTDRELEILNLVCLEKTNSEISTILNLSVRTVESHRRRMIDKTECKSIIGVVLSAIELQNLNLQLKFNDNRQLI